jgi:hypothetical protein
VASATHQRRGAGGGSRLGETPPDRSRGTSLLAQQVVALLPEGDIGLHVPSPAPTLPVPFAPSLRNLCPVAAVHSAAPAVRGAVGRTSAGAAAIHPEVAAEVHENGAATKARISDSCRACSRPAWITMIPSPTPRRAVLAVSGGGVKHGSAANTREEKPAGSLMRLSVAAGSAEAPFTMGLYSCWATITDA